MEFVSIREILQADLNFELDLLKLNPGFFATSTVLKDDFIADIC